MGELNGYVSFMGGNKFGFVGLDRITGNMATFHIKSVAGIAILELVVYEKGDKKWFRALLQIYNTGYYFVGMK